MNNVDNRIAYIQILSLCYAKEVTAIDTSCSVVHISLLRSKNRYSNDVMMDTYECEFVIAAR